MIHSLCLRFEMRIRGFENATNWILTSTNSKFPRQKKVVAVASKQTKCLCLLVPLWSSVEHWWHSMDDLPSVYKGWRKHCDYFSGQCTLMTDTPNGLSECNNLGRVISGASRLEGQRLDYSVFGQDTKLPMILYCHCMNVYVWIKRLVEPR